MNRPLVSILVPAYNHERFVGRALDSVIEDTYVEKELIIVDDGSSDGTSAEIEGWLRKNGQSIAHAFVSRANRGLCETLNEMIAMSHGEYLVPLASDDYLVNDTIAERVRILEERPDKMVVLADSRIVDENGIEIAPSSIEFYGGAKTTLSDESGLIRQVILRPVFSGPLIMVKRELYREIGPFPGRLPIEDWFFWQRAAGLRKVVFFDNVVSCYRRHGSNTTSSSSGRGLEIQKGIISTYIMNLGYFRGPAMKVLAIRQVIRRSIVLGYSSLRSTIRRIASASGAADRT